MNNAKPLKAVLFDIDGTLIDSNGAHALAWQAAFSHFGRSIPYELIRRKIGKGGDKLVPELTGLDADSELGRQISEYRKKLFKKRYLPRLQPFPRSIELIRKIKSEGLKVTTASSSSKEDLKGILKRLGTESFMGSLFDVKVSAGHAENSKPDPDILHAAMEELDCDASELIMIGDTPYDIEAATRVGIPSIAFRSGGWPDGKLAGAIAIYDHPADLLHHYEESPLAALKVGKSGSVRKAA